MNKIAILSLAILSGLSLTTLGAAARGGPGGAKPAFTEIDTDGDGRVTPAEIEAHRTARGPDRFEAADVDGDGNLTRDEMLAARTEQAESRVDALIERLDSNGDSMLSKAELEAGKSDRGDRGDRGARMFDRADTDGDGALSAQEWEAIGPRGPRGRN